MSRRMSVSMTLDAVRAREKTVTRRHVDSWTHLKAGDRLTLIEKGMGLPKGAKQVVVCDVEIVDVRVEQLVAMRAEEHATWKEGLPHMTVPMFESFWLGSHGYRQATDSPWDVDVRRIEWRYLDD